MVFGVIITFEDVGRQPIKRDHNTKDHQQISFIIEHSTRSQKKDLDTLFIVAGCAGAGKSTIIRTSHLLNLPLFGNDFHQKFRETCTSPNFDEYKGYTDAKKYGSIFQARHLTRLEQDRSIFFGVCITFVFIKIWTCASFSKFLVKVIAE
jgi:ABC-type methionine transport system ATPase subunit